MRSLVAGLDVECFERKLIQDSKHAVLAFNDMRIAMLLARVACVN